MTPDKTQATLISQITSLRGIMMRDFEEGSYGLELLDKIKAGISALTPTDDAAAFGAFNRVKIFCDFSTKKAAPFMIDAVKALNADLETLRASLSSHQVSAWQPIESAPRDGSAILIWDEERQIPIAVKYNSAEYIWNWECVFSHGAFKDYVPKFWKPIGTGPATPTPSS